MGNKSPISQSEINCPSLSDFIAATPRKMTIHILSNNKNDCRKFAHCLSGEKMSNDSNELLEKTIIKKLNLYSFMNFKIYDNINELITKLNEQINHVKINLKTEKAAFSEAIVFLDNENISKQLYSLKKYIEDELIMTPYYTPFCLFLSPQHLDLKGLMPSKKTFQFNITLEDIIKSTIKQKAKEQINTEVSAFFRRLNVIFSYYNELGDEISFKTTENKEFLVKIEDDSEISVFMNILLMGKSGAGKSTLINLLLDEKKSIEGGTGFSTTSKDIIVYKKSNIPLRFYEVKGIENEETIENFSKFLKNHNGENDATKDAINAIIFCIEYINGTFILEEEFKLFEKLINFSIPIIFLITKTPYNPEAPCRFPKMAKKRKIEQENIIKGIKDLFKSLFTKNNKSEKFESFYKDNVRTYFMNLVRDLKTDNPPFGFDKFIKFFTDSVPLKDWEELEKSCLKNQEENCKLYCKNNPFLKYYSDFEKIKSRNKDEALEYLKGLKAGAFFSGMVPGSDISMEYYYRNIFKTKLKALYGFDYDLAEEVAKGKKKDKKKEEELILTQKDYEEIKNNISEEEKHIESQINKEVKIIRGKGELGGIVIKSLPTAVETGAVATRFAISGKITAASWALFPVTCTAFGALSCVNIYKDCNKILDIFDKAFTPLRFKTLLAYVQSFRVALEYLEYIGKKIIKDDEEENESSY